MTLKNSKFYCSSTGSAALIYGMATNNQPRESKGRPTGGQFVAKKNPESPLELSDVNAAYYGDVSHLRERSRTPWGSAQYVDHLAPGIAVVSTAGHGGVKLSRERNRRIPTPLRRDGGWYEEDCEAGIPTMYYPEAFCLRYEDPVETIAERGRQTVMDWFPDEYEEALGVTIPRGASYIKDQHEWDTLHTNDESAISARGFGYDLPDGMVAVTVMKGGYGSGPSTRTILVHKDDYHDPANRHPVGKCGGSFVVDPSKDYQEIATT